MVVSIWLYQDKIINHFVREANKSLNTPIDVKKIYISVWADFPTISIFLKDVYVEDSHPGKYPLLEAASVSFSLNIMDLMRGNYNIRGLQLTDARINLRINDNGVGNYDIIKKKEDSSSSSLSFDVKNVRLKEVTVLYKSLSAKQEHLFETAKMQANIKFRNNIYEIESEGDVLTKYIKINNTAFFENKLFDVKAFVSYDDTEKIVYISPSLLSTPQAQFEVYGDYRFKETPSIVLHTEGKNTNIQTLLALLPENISQRFEQYQSSGLAYFDLKLSGELSKNKSPELTINFGLENAGIYNAQFKSRIEGANLEGIFRMKSLGDIINSELELKNINGTLNGNAYQASFYLRNFDDPFVLEIIRESDNKFHKHKKPRI